MQEDIHSFSIYFFVRTIFLCQLLGQIALAKVKIFKQWSLPMGNDFDA
jgi:hypothetical protein